MKKVLMSLSMGILFLVGTSAFADVKIGVLDISKVLMDAPQLNVAKDQLKKQFQPRDQSIVDAQKKLKADIDGYTKNSPTMKAADQKAAQQKIMDEQKSLQDLQVKFQNDVNDAQNKAMQDIMKKVEGIVAKIAADQKYDMVVYKNGVIFSNPKSDITDFVAAEMKK
jgi:outer membrane protein